MSLDERYLFVLEHRIELADQRALIGRARQEGKALRGVHSGQSRPSWIWLGLAEPNPKSIPSAGHTWVAGQTDPERNLGRWGFFARLDPAIEWVWSDSEASEIVRRVLEPVLPLYERMTKVGITLQIPGQGIAPHRDLVPGNRYQLESRYHWRPGPRSQVYLGEPWLGSVRPIASASHADNDYLCLKIPISDRPGDAGRPYLQVGRVRHTYQVGDQLYFLNEAEALQGAGRVDFWRGTVSVSGILRRASLGGLARRPATVIAESEIPPDGVFVPVVGDPPPEEANAFRQRVARAADELRAAQRVLVKDLFDALRPLDFRGLSPEEAAEKIVVPLLKEAPNRGWSEVARLVLPPHLAYERDIARARTAREASVRRVWLSGPHHLCHAFLYVVYLYNADYGAARASLDSLFRMKDPHPYPRTLFAYLLRDILGVSRDELIRLERGLNDPALWAPYLNELFASNRIEPWLRRLNKPIKFYSAYTNTVLGMYDWISTHPASGLAPPPAVDVSYDLGGGHATPYIADLLQLPFVCLDIASPRLPVDTDLILRRRAESPTGDGVEPLGQSEQEEYIGKLNRTPWKQFDVYADRFEQTHDRYLITSFGFMTSTPIGFPSAIPASTRGVNEALATSLQALVRVMELVLAGKTVHLFTYQRATWRRPALNTCLLSFADGKLDRVAWTRVRPPRADAPHIQVDAELRRTVHELVDPSTSSYAQLVAGGRAVKGGTR